MVLSMDYEEKSFFRKRICDEFSYLANNGAGSSVLEDIIVESLSPLLGKAAGEDNNWAVMMAVERLLTGACIAAKRRGMSGDYIQGLMQRIEMANYIGD